MNIVDHRLIERFEPIAHTKNLQAASRVLLRSVGIEPLSIRGSVPSKGPLLLISNHPGGLDTFTLLASVARQDFYVIALSTYHIYGKTLNNHLLPIYRKKGWNHRIFEYPLNLIPKSQRKNLSTSEIQKRNRETISKAAKLISSGNAVSVFPTGSAGKPQPSTRWKTGLGYLVKQITNKNTQVVCIRIEGSRKTDWLRFISPPLRKIFFTNTPRTVSISSAYKLTTLIRGCKNELDVVRKLETTYKNIWRHQKHET